VTASLELAKNLDHHTLNEHGLSKRYVRSLQVIRVLLVSYFLLQYYQSSLNIMPLLAYAMYNSVYTCASITLLTISPCQISEVVNHMKGLIEFSNKNKIGPKGMVIVLNDDDSAYFF
jgi:hypothetical protein